MLQKYLKAIIGQILVGDKPRHFRNASALRQGRDKRIGIRSTQRAGRRHYCFLAGSIAL